MPEPSDDFGSRHLEASYEDIEFPTDDVEVQGGHDFAAHSMYGQDGVDHEHTGGKPNSGMIRALLFNDIGYGDIWPSRFYSLVRKMQSKPIGKLIHPIYGEMRVAILDWTVKSSAKIRSGFTIDIVWRQDRTNEFDGVAGFTSSQNRGDVPGAISNAAAASDAYATVLDGPDGYQPVSPSVDTALTIIDDPDSLYQDVVTAFRDTESILSNNIELAGNDASYHQLSVALEMLNSSFSRMFSRFVPSSRTPLIYVAKSNMTLFDVALEVYGDASRVSDIYRANSILHGNVLAGDRIVIPRV